MNLRDNFGLILTLSRLWVRHNTSILRYIRNYRQSAKYTPRCISSDTRRHAQRSKLHMLRDQARAAACSETAWSSPKVSSLRPEWLTARSRDQSDALGGFSRVWISRFPASPLWWAERGASRPAPPVVRAPWTWRQPFVWRLGVEPSSDSRTATPISHDRPQV